MTQFARHFILYGLVLFFIIIAPSVVFYAWGYDFDWEKKTLVLTGGLYVNSMPEKAEIYINSKLKGKTPLLVKRLLPKEYQIKLAKEGYQTWEKKIKIQSTLVSEVKNVILIPDNPILTSASSTLAENFSLNELNLEPNSGYIYYFQKPSNFLYETDQNHTLTKQISLSPLDLGENYKIISSKNNQIAALDKTAEELYILDPNKKEFIKISSEVKDAHFSGDGKKLLYLSSSEIWVYYLRFPQNPRQEKSNYELITRLSQKIYDVNWYGMTDQHIIFTTNDALKIAELDDHDKRNIFDVIRMNNIKEIGYSEKDNKIYIVRNHELLTIDIE